MVFPFLAAAVVGSGIVGALSGNSAAKKAANASQEATDKTIALQKEQYDQTRADLSPYAEAGRTGLDALQQRAASNDNAYGSVTNPTYTAPAAFSYGEGDYKQSPGYQFQLDRGLDAIQSSQASRGAMYSGATQKAIAKFSQGLAAQDFNQERQFAYGKYIDQNNRDRTNYTDDRDYLTNRYDTQTGTVANLAGIGQNAAAGTAAAGSAYAANVGNAYSQNAATKANAGLVQSSNLNNLMGQGLNAYARYAA